MAATVTSYVPLLLRSNFSLLTGTAPINDILQKAKHFGIGSVALTDINNLYTAIPFYKKAKELGIKPIIGVELNINFMPYKTFTERFFLFARNYEGYSNICKIISLVMLDEGLIDDSDSDIKHQPINTIDSNRYMSKTIYTKILEKYFAPYHKGIYFLTENPITTRYLINYIDKQFIRLLIIRPDQNLTKQREIFIKSKELEIDVIGVVNTFFIEKKDYGFHKLLTAIKNNDLLSETANNRQDNYLNSFNVTESNYFYSPQEVYNLFSDCPDLIENGNQMALDCNLEIPFGNYVFPKFPIPKGEHPTRYLYDLCLQGLSWRYGVIKQSIINRLKYEIDVIDKLGFPEYFLVVGDIIRYARKEDIPVVGRGSGASSIVAYSLGITNVDPIKYNLCFERFMHHLRKDFPDLDIDLCWQKRDAVINYVYNTYGSNHVAMISTHNCFQPRSAFREVAKAYGMANHEVNKYSKYIPYNIDYPLTDIDKKINPFKILATNNKSFTKIMAMADQLNGTPRHLGIHSGGVVITDNPINGYVPLEKSTKGIVVTQYDMHSIEDIGLIKLDLLGNRALSTLREAVDLIKKNHNIKINLDTIPDKDNKAVNLLKNGLTLGCFQIESPGMRNLLKMLKVGSIDETIASLSLIRPGPASGGLKESYVRRAHGLEKTIHLHPLLEPILKDSYGIMLYEEDAIRAASVIAGISLAGGDQFRRSIASAKTNSELDEIAKRFIQLAAKNGITKDMATKIGRYIANFASYTFCRAHAAGYGYIAYQGAYLKAHFSAEFIVSLLNNHQGMYGRHVHIEEARRMGLKIFHPCVNNSNIEYSVENDNIRIGLNQIRGLTIRVMQQIVEMKPFTSLTDFLNKIKINKKEVESLIKCGAFDFINKVRPELMWEFETTSKTKKIGQQDFAEFSLDFNVTTMPLLKDYHYEKKYWDEYDTLGLFTYCHPMKLYNKKSSNKMIANSNTMSDFVGKRVMISGILAARRGAETKRKEKMMFITLEDENGLFEVTLFPSVYRKYKYMLTDIGPYTVRGKVENQYGALTITADEIKPF